MQELRIKPVAPYMMTSVELAKEYEQLKDFTIPLSTYQRRGADLAWPEAKCSAPYIPDSLEDRLLMKKFLTFSEKKVDFGLFRERVRRGWDLKIAANTPPRLNRKTKTRARGEAKHRPGSLRTIYEFAAVRPAVSFGTFHARVHRLHWTIENALTTPAR